MPRISHIIWRRNSSVCEVLKRTGCGWDMSEWSKRKKWQSYLNTGEKETIDENRKTKETEAGVPGRDQKTPSTRQGEQPVQQDCTGLLYLHIHKCTGLGTWLSRGVNRIKY